MASHGSGVVRTRRRTAPLLRDAVVIVAIAIVASVLVKTFLIQSFYIPSVSMEPTLRGDPGHDDRILVDRLVPSLVPLQRGDVVVFRDPGGWLAGAVPAVHPARTAGPLQQALAAIGPFGSDDGGHLAKRVIGLPGDRVRCCDALGRMSVNGTALDEPYARVPPGYSAVSRDPFDVVVLPGTLWVMGDNRYDSKDSRYQQATPSEGFVPLKDVTGRAFVISWPISRWQWLSNHPGTFDRVRPASTSGG